MKGMLMKGPPNEMVFPRLEETPDKIVTEGEASDRDRRMVLKASIQNLFVISLVESRTAYSSESALGEWGEPREPCGHAQQCVCVICKRGTFPPQCRDFHYDFMCVICKRGIFPR